MSEPETKTPLEWETWHFRRPGWTAIGQKATALGFIYYISLDNSFQTSNWYEIEIDRMPRSKESLTLRCSRRTIQEVKEVAESHHAQVAIAASGRDKLVDALKRAQAYLEREMPIESPSFWAWKGRDLRFTVDDALAEAEPKKEQK